MNLETLAQLSAALVDSDAELSSQIADLEVRARNLDAEMKRAQLEQEALRELVDALAFFAGRK